MKRFSEQFNTKAKTVKLQAAEKRELKERVISYMEYHPLPSEMKVGSTPSTILQGEAFTMVRVPFAVLARWSAAVAVLVLMVVPVMAEQAVPGDGLYAVKVRFNEEIRGSLANTTYEKIEWETEKLNRRVAEARLLASEGRLTDEVEAEVAAAVKQHTENAKREIEVLRAEDAEEATLAAIEFNSTLEVQSASLRDLDEDAEVEAGDSSETPLLASVLDESISVEGQVNASSSVPSFEKLTARVETNTTRVYELLSALNLAEDDEDRKDIVRRLDDIGRTVVEANELRESDDIAARQLLVNSLQRTQRLIVYMTQIQVAGEIEVEEIVPVILTPEEEIQAINDYRQSVREQIEILETTITLNTNVELTEKATYTLSLLKEADVTISSSTDYTQVKTVAEEANAQADDILSLLNEFVDTTRASSTEDAVEADTEAVEERGTSTESVTE